MRVIVLKHNKVSNGVNNLLAAIKEINPKLPWYKRYKETYTPRIGDKIINWGCSMLNFPVYINPIGAIQYASDKIKTLTKLATDAVNTLTFTTNPQEALQWVKEGKLVVGRSLINASGGKGIVLIDKEEAFINCPLYTLYQPKQTEFRVHVFKNTIIDTQEKRKKQGVEADFKIRNHDKGWIFCRENITPDPRRDELAIKAVSSLGLDFGAVDIIYNKTKNSYYVLEVNTAPGIENTTAKHYAETFIHYVYN